jgi:acylphosphatase
MPTMHLLIKGKVQGVFYRASARDVANELGVKGWIRNTEEGNVEAEVSGEQQILDRFVEWCGKGPFGAIVQGIEAITIEEKNFNAFLILRGS